MHAPSPPPAKARPEHAWQSRGDGTSTSRSISWEEYNARRHDSKVVKNKHARKPVKRRSVRISILRGNRQTESPNNLSRYRWHHPLPDAARDAELVRLAKAGDRKAGAELVSNYHRYIIGRAFKHRINARDDLIGRGFEALWLAVLRYKPSMGVPFSAFAKLCIRGQMSEESKAFVKRGITFETRIDRWLFSHPRATPADLVAAWKRKGKHIDHWEAEQEINAHKARYQYKQYSDEYLERPKHKSNRRPSAETYEGTTQWRFQRTLSNREYQSLYRRK
jgi:hypothetical protein